MKDSNRIDRISTCHGAGKMNQEFEKNYNEIIGKILQEFMEEHLGENVVFSPYSILALLAIAANATAGDSRAQIIRAIAEHRSYEDVMKAICKLQKSLEAAAQLTSANAVLVQDSISGSIVDGYEDQLKAQLDGSLIVSKDIVMDVNAWVKEKTNGMIQKIADDSMKDMLVCLINAVFFDADWKDKYEDDNVYEDDFTNADGTRTEVTMLNSVEDTYLENEFFTGFVKPYKSNYSFLALLPRKQKSKTFFSRAIKALDFSELYRSRTRIETHVTMPEFTMEFGQDITDICKKMGIKEIFTPAADFSSMSSEWLQLDQIIHKAKIEVNRKGTRASAATMGVVVAGCCPDFERVKYVYLDRPFIYAVVQNKTGLPVFTGMVNQL